MSEGLYTLLRKFYLTLRYISYASGTVAVGFLIYAKLTGSDERLMTGFLFAGATFTLFLISYVVYGLMRLLVKHQDEEQINP